MKKRSAFTLVEVLIAMFISSFIILSMTQIYRNVVKFIGRSDESMILNRQVYLLFNQIEKDITPAYIPKLHKEEEQKKDPEKKVEDKSKKEESEIKNPFTGQIYEDEYRRVSGKKWELFKTINFITTNPLYVYGKRHVCLVRVMYELVKDKEKSFGEKISYKLFRKETTDLKNYKFLKPGETLSKKEKQQKQIREFLVAENIKDFYVEYITKKEEQEDKKTSQEPEQVNSFIWPPKKEIKKDLPDKVDVYIAFWDNKLDKNYSFECLIPLFTYSGAQEEKKKEEDKKVKSKVIPPAAKK